ncbi:hypothetical protein Tco_1102000 [Tanacetum coccineum]
MMLLGYVCRSCSWEAEKRIDRGAGNIFSAADCNKEDLLCVYKMDREITPGYEGFSILSLVQGNIARHDTRIEFTNAGILLALYLSLIRVYGKMKLTISLQETSFVGHHIHDFAVWTLNMFRDCERRNFVQGYHRDILEHWAPPPPLGAFSYCYRFTIRGDVD